MKWGTRYGACYVNRLRNMVRRHLTLPHRFICFTDDAEGIEPGIEIRPLLKVKIPAGPEQYWNKLGFFRNPLADIGGPVLSLDLDLIIVGSLDCFFEKPGKFLILREFRSDAKSMKGNSSVMRFQAGAHADLLVGFHKDPSGMAARYRFDQDFISATVRPLEFWPEGWCVSFRQHCMGRGLSCWVRPPRIPPGARIIVFHGFPNPPDVERGYFRFRSLKYCPPTNWVGEHWR
jgi:hypothetical protein